MSVQSITVPDGVDTVELLFGKKKIIVSRPREPSQSEDDFAIIPNQTPDSDSTDSCPVPRSKNTTKKYWVVTKVSSTYTGRLRVGCYFDSWARVVIELPGRTICGSGVTLKSFTDRATAVAFWNDKFVTEIVWCDLA